VERISEHVQNVNVDVSPVEYIARTVNNIPDEYTRKAALAIWKEIPWLILRYLLLTSFLFFFWTMSLFVLLILRSAPHISRKRLQTAKRHVVKKNEPVLEKIESSAVRALPVG
jgi:hypothetical protein